MVYEHGSFFMLWCLDRASMHLYLLVSFIMATMFSDCSVGKILKIKGSNGLAFISRLNSLSHNFPFKYLHLSEGVSKENLTLPSIHQLLYS